jgi:hypothetical protein
MVLLSVNITADDRALVQVLKEMKSEPRVALVIGNKDYTSLNSLKNPLNDARDMADILRKKGFYVIPLENASQYQMEQAIVEFSDKIRSGKGVGLFYYAGHGVEVGGVNYLIPSDARIPSLDFVKSKTVSVDSVISAMENAQNRFNILILDACRSNPFGRGGGGLAPINSATGIYVAYATAPSKIAEDGAGENGLFTSYLKKYINQSGLKIEEVFKNVRREVRKASHKRQTPWTSSSVDGDFYFSLPTQPIVQHVITSTPKPSATSSKWMKDTGEEATWKKAKEICRAKGGRLPTREELRKVMTDCGGISNSDFLGDDAKQNRGNSSYQSCYKAKGFTSYGYWSSTTNASDSSYAWNVTFDDGDGYWSGKTDEYYVRCVRGGQ